MSKSQGAALHDMDESLSGGRRPSFWQRNEFIRHVVALMSGTAAAQIITFVATIALGRMYSPAEFGVLTAFMSVTAMVSVLATLRYDMAIMLPEDDRTAIVLRRGVRWIAGIVSAIVTLVMLFVSAPLADLINAPAAAPWLLATGLGAFTLAEISALNFWLNRKSRYTSMASNRVVQSGATAVGQLGLWFARVLGSGGLVLGAIFGQAISVLALRHRTPELRRAPRLAKGELRAALYRFRKMPLLNVPTALLDSFRMNGINLAIGAIATGAAMGQFGMAWRIVEVPAVLISSALAQVFFQRLATTARGSLRSAAVTSIVRAAAFGVVPFALVYLLSPWAFPTVLGAEWEQAGLFGQVLVPWLFMNLITSPISTIFVIADQQLISLWFAVFYTIVPIAVLLYLRDDPLAAVTAMSWSMALMLVVNVALALFVAARWDKAEPPALADGGE